jgi:RNA-directed DNA polymerase
MAGTSPVGRLSRVTLRSGEEVDLWSARDAVVMKALALVVAQHLPLAKPCTHVKGHGGLKGAVRPVLAKLPQARFILKTDVQSSEASIDHHVLRTRLAAHITDDRVLNLIGQYLRRCAEQGGLFGEHTKGIRLGSALSPIIGACFLTELDAQLDTLGLFDVRLMDDILVLAPTRWKLRQAVTVVNQGLAALRLHKHPDKTLSGRVDKGYDFLGDHVHRDRLTVAPKTLEHVVERLRRLDEREPEETRVSSRLGVYVQRWVRWVQVGVSTSLTLPDLGSAWRDP